ncbi:NAC domain-containing protein 68-like [Camellia sinensis]|uniref:NAC domain-containing protein 68-like n=1 Tax=Camellia sinensis TaxID=4442 RepID=UPI0010357764|nr:NAC domain-containing protein 68-like [Camellia sinensis]
MTIPLGFKFFPSDQELIHYLLQKSTARPLPCDNVIKDYDLYGEKEPSTIFDGAEANIHYIFTILKKKTKKGARVDRTAGTGTWKGVDASKPIYDGNRRLIGSKKNFVYLTKSKTKGGWNMVEYNLEGIAEKHALKLGKVTDYVICRITKNAISKNRIREEGQVNKWSISSGGVSRQQSIRGYLDPVAQFGGNKP